ncbi:SpoIID/LytB domain-containing protein [Paenibacillus abyssi]|uniref:Sporulation stage II protein D amidase enhancer LytB N-terminal domain-containing protein n=1 Tax=Paenibacillus abyssi TaxID=1340531 RepID=A0A917G368_9BACL|nr:SpoIID/LytB domain-containing protein [Paenibacillus abyssi]GGG20153.1 hypothetical protein GCM10010916_41140 [Paenibacillus abyssi]
MQRRNAVYSLFRRTISMRRFSAALAVMLVIVTAASVWPSYGAVPKLDQIRVAIFLNLPGKYTTTVPSVTFSSKEGLAIGIRQPAGVDVWFQADAAKKSRFALDDYKILIGETADFNRAVSMLKRVQSASNAVWLTSINKSGQTMYQVKEGTYLSEAEAKTASERWSRDAALMNLTSQQKPTLFGPLHLESGPYGSIAAAKTAAAAAGGGGVDAFVVMKKDSAAGGLQYFLHVGAAANKAALDAIKTKASNIASLGALVEADPSVPYLQLHDDYTLTQNLNASDALYMFAGSSTKVWLSTADSARITLAERYNRSYRGQFEVSGLNNRLAVINELPFEQYLYSVVGAEMPASWHLDALKAQAVAARTYVVSKGFGFQIAHVVDGVLSQAYGGVGAEKPSTIEAVDATAGEVILYQGKVIEALYSSSAGGASADASEIWGNSIPYLLSVPSPDQVSENGLYQWYRVVLPDGRTGYIREDLVVGTGERTAAGSPVMRVKGNGVLVRPIPLIQSGVDPVAQINDGTRVVVLEKAVQSNPMSWVRGPFSAQALLASMKDRVRTPISGAIRTVEVSGQGPSGRVTAIHVNGQRLDIRYPDTFRSALGELPSTRFQVDETGRIAMLGADRQTTERPADSSTIYTVGADGQTRPLVQDNIYIADGSGNVRAATKDPQFRFIGQGNGHGVGLSQWGAKGLADQGYDYQEILKYYYKNVTIAKE